MDLKNLELTPTREVIAVGKALDNHKTIALLYSKLLPRLPLTRPGTEIDALKPGVYCAEVCQTEKSLGTARNHEAVQNRSIRAVAAIAARPDGFRVWAWRATVTGPAIRIHHSHAACVS
jgi:hypothetical protein